MGLGKTFQTVALLAYLKKTRGIGGPSDGVPGNTEYSGAQITSHKLHVCVFFI